MKFVISRAELSSLIRKIPERGPADPRDPHPIAFFN